MVSFEQRLVEWAQKGSACVLDCVDGLESTQDGKLLIRNDVVSVEEEHSVHCLIEG